MASGPTQHHTRGLQRIWVPDHSCWVFVWSADDGDLDRNHRITYACISSPAEFSPQQGQFVLIGNSPNDNSIYCYGVPYQIEQVSGVVKVYYTDLSPALGFPNTYTNEDPGGKDPGVYGWCLEGQFGRESLDGGPILWNVKEQGLHNNPLSVIEVTDVQDVDIASKIAKDGTVVPWVNQYGAPSGALLVQYERDSTGRIKTDADGFPRITQIESSGDQSYTAQNFKTGYLALTFQKDYFGVGLHGWTSGEIPETPFQVVKVNIPTNDPENPFKTRLGVIDNSHLFNTEDKDTYEEDNTEWGLLDPEDLEGTTFDPGELGGKIWLQIELEDDQSIKTISLEWQDVGETIGGGFGSGNRWSLYPDPIEINSDDPDNIFQKYYYQIIAEYTDPAEDPRPGFTIHNPNDDEVQVTQILNHNLQMTTAHTNQDADEPNLHLLVASAAGQNPGTTLDGKANEINSSSDLEEGNEDGDIMTPWAFGDPPIPGPFEVIHVKNPVDTGNDSLIAVSDNSHVFNTEDKDTYEEDNSDWGLFVPSNLTGTSFDVGNIGDKIWLTITLSAGDQSIVAIDIKHGPTDTDWQYYPDPIEINTDNKPYQKYYHQIIAEITDPEEDPRPGFTVTKADGSDVQITQVLFSNLQMTTAHTNKDADEPNLPILVAVASANFPATSDDGHADEINSGDDIMTPYALGEKAADIELPYQVVEKIDTDDDGNVIGRFLGVISNSHLFNSEDKDTYEEDNTDWGLLDDDQTVGWFDVPSTGSKIWLKVELDPNDQSIIAIDVMHGPVGDVDWPYYPDPIEINTDGSPYQQFYHQIIAEITDPEQDPRPGIQTQIGAIGDEVQVTQLLFTNLMMTSAQTTADADEPNVPLLVALPWNFPGTNENGSADEINSGDDTMTPWQFVGGTNLVIHPYTIFPAKDGAITIYPGAINGALIASNMFDTFTLPNATGLNYVVLQVSTDGTKPVSAIIVVQTSPLTPADNVTTNAAPATHKTYIGVVRNKVIKQIRQTNLFIVPRVMAISSVPSPTPFQDPYNRALTWQETS